MGTLRLEHMINLEEICLIWTHVYNLVENNNPKLNKIIIKYDSGFQFFSENFSLAKTLLKYRMGINIALALMTK